MSLAPEPIVIGMRIKPQTREQRRIEQNRDYLEKQRVCNRHENFERHVEHEFQRDYNEHHRFGDDFESQERARKAEKAAARQEYLQMRGQNYQQMEQLNQQRAVEAQEHYNQTIQAKGTKKNISGEPFNIITREYHDPNHQKKVDAQNAHDIAAAEARKENIAKNMGMGRNPLTGEEYNWRKPPVQPQQQQ